MFLELCFVTAKDTGCRETVQPHGQSTGQRPRRLRPGASSRTSPPHLPMPHQEQVSAAMRKLMHMHRKHGVQGLVPKQELLSVPVC